MTSSPAACAICGKPVVVKFRPFCSLRCAEVDLGRWFGETYRVPSVHGAEDDPPPEADDPPRPG